MNNKREFPAVSVTPKGAAWLKGGHPWLYCDEITGASGDIDNGCLVDVLTSKGGYIGTGLYSAASKIRVRLLSDNANERFSDAFWERRLRYAVDYRRTVMGRDFDCCRLIFGEADGLPGLTVDRYSDILVVQALSFGIAQRLGTLMAKLVEILGEFGVPVRGIYERSDLALREREGLPERAGWIDVRGEPFPDKTTVGIAENGILYTVDFAAGQKTGFFLDQKYNRLAVSKITAGKTVLDCFTHTGSFALNAAKGGAAHVTAVDVSSSALDLARDNARLNNLEGKMDFVCADVFDLLPGLAEAGCKKYDFIILDPPAFTKSRKTVGGAERGYYEINRRAMKLLPRGGYLATCSCSHFMENSLFVKMLGRAAAEARVSLKQVESRQQSPDHPILWNVPETDYLKFYIFQVV